MSTLRLYIWENSGISSGYHNNGSLVILATSVQEARAIAIKAATGPSKYPDPRKWPDGAPPYVDIYTPEYYAGKGISANPESPYNPAIDKPPTRIISLTKPQFVLFNGGGYD